MGIDFPGQSSVALARTQALTANVPPTVEAFSMASAVVNDAWQLLRMGAGHHLRSMLRAAEKEGPAASEHMQRLVELAVTTLDVTVEQGPRQVRRVYLFPYVGATRQDSATLVLSRSEQEALELAIGGVYDEAARVAVNPQLLGDTLFRPPAYDHLHQTLGSYFHPEALTYAASLRLTPARERPVPEWLACGYLAVEITFKCPRTGLVWLEDLVRPAATFQQRYRVWQELLQPLHSFGPWYFPEPPTYPLEAMAAGPRVFQQLRQQLAPAAQVVNAAVEASLERLSASASGLVLADAIRQTLRGMTAPETPLKPSLPAPEDWRLVG